MITTFSIQNKLTQKPPLPFGGGLEEDCVGSFGEVVGCSVGVVDGFAVGERGGERVGEHVGECVGKRVGASVGVPVPLHLRISCHSLHVFHNLNQREGYHSY